MNFISDKKSQDTHVDEITNISCHTQQINKHNLCAMCHHINYLRNYESNISHQIV